MFFALFRRSPLLVRSFATADKVLEAHKARRKKDKNAIMTMVFKEAAPHHRTRSLEDDLVVGLDAETGQLLHFDNDKSAKSVHLEVTVRHTQSRQMPTTLRRE